MKKVTVTYVCDICGSISTDSIKKFAWFLLQIKVFPGDDPKDISSQHVCNLTCAGKAMQNHPKVICIEWCKMDAIDIK